MQIDELSTKIQQLGLSSKQSRVMVAGMLLGPAPASKLAEQAGISRPSTYDILAELEDLGLAERTNRESITLFSVVDFNGLKYWLENQQSELEKRCHQLAGMRDDLLELTRQAPAAQPRVRFVEGQAGIVAMHDEARRKARVGSTIYSMTDHDKTLTRFPEHVEENTSLRLKKQLKSRQYYHNSRQEIVSNPANLKETLRLNEPLSGDVTLYEDQAILLSYDGEWSGVMIESPAIVDTLRRLFELAWRDSKKLSK